MGKLKKKIYEFAKESYYWELNRKEQLNSFVSVGIAIISAQIGVIAYISNSFPNTDKKVVFIMFIVFFALSVLSAILSLYYLFRHQLKYTYAVLSTPKEINDYINSYAEYNEKNEVCAEESEYCQEIDETILDQYMSHTNTNFQNNNRKSKYSYRLKLTLVFTTIFLISSFAFYIFTDKEDKIQKDTY